VTKERRTIRLKRVYDAPEKSDGCRILVDRLWPRGLTKEKAQVDLWAKEIAPSTELRKWYAHDPEKWPELKRRYAAELDANPEQLEAIMKEVKKGVVTFLFASKEERFNSAVALKEYIERTI
jgi:uncharacterized protein YeaO (DUF488 family)